MLKIDAGSWLLVLQQDSIAGWGWRGWSGNWVNGGGGGAMGGGGNGG